LVAPPVAEVMAFSRATFEGAREHITRAIAVEMPVALEINGAGYAVLMATPADLDDLATGYLFTERLIRSAADLVEADATAVEGGLLIRVLLAPERAEHVTARVRHRATDSSCGLCGVENLEQALRPLPRVRTTSRADDGATFRALAALDGFQSLNRTTGAVHAAAFCSADGRIQLVREDVGRHNAMDKLIGAMLRSSEHWNGGFALLTSRCSYELVEKAVLADCPLLATVSAPTSLALNRAHEAGLKLKVLVRQDALLDPAP
jgi:FdhD protein